VLWIAAHLLGKTLEDCSAGVVLLFLKQLYLEAEYLPKAIHVLGGFEDRDCCRRRDERAGTKVQFFTPQRGTKRGFLI